MSREHTGTSELPLQKWQAFAGCRRDSLATGCDKHFLTAAFAAPSLPPVRVFQQPLHGAGHGPGCLRCKEGYLHCTRVQFMLGVAGQRAAGRECIYLHVWVSEAAGRQVVCVHCNRFLLCSHIFIFVKCQRVHRTLVVQATKESNNSNNRERRTG